MANASRSRSLLALSPGARRCVRKFLRLFPEGYRDAEYVDPEWDYKWEAHQRWKTALDGETIQSFIWIQDSEEYQED